MDEIFIRYSDAPVHICPGSIRQECYADEYGCGTNCDNHHKNIKRLAMEIRGRHYSSNTLPVFWSNAPSNTYCEYRSGRHTPLSAYGVVAKEETFEGSNVYVSIPVAMILTIDYHNSLSGSCSNIAFMSIILAHEVAHTLGLKEVYEDYYGTKSIHESIPIPNSDKL